MRHAGSFGTGTRSIRAKRPGVAGDVVDASGARVAAVIPECGDDLVANHRSAHPFHTDKVMRDWREDRPRAGFRGAEAGNRCYESKKDNDTNMSPQEGSLHSVPPLNIFT